MKTIVFYTFYETMSTRCVLYSGTKPSKIPSDIRRSVKFSDIIIYENWTTDVMEREIDYEPIHKALNELKEKDIQWLRMALNIE